MLKIKQLLTVLVLVSIIYSDRVVDLNYWSELPPTENIRPSLNFSESSRAKNVKSIGKGKTGVADGKNYNGMLDNPALLAHKKRDLDLIGVEISITDQTRESLNFYLTDDDVQNGTFLNDAKDGFKDYGKAFLFPDSVELRLEAIDKINSAIEVAENIIDSIAGSPVPNQHTVSIKPKIQMQWDRWGFSYSREAQASVIVVVGDLLEDFTSYRFKTDKNGVITTNDNERFNNWLVSTFNQDGSIKSNALPKFIVLKNGEKKFSAGYAFNIEDKLDFGLNVHIVNRHFEVSVIELSGPNSIFKESAEELAAPSQNLGITMDFGVLFRSKKIPIDIGVSMLNVFPMHMLEDEIVIYENESTQEILRDSDGSVCIDSKGDTLVSVEEQLVKTVIPLTFDNPLNLRVGGVWRPFQFLDFALEIHDLFAFDNITYKKYTERLSLGVELDFRDILYLRGGMTSLRATVGGGVDLILFKHGKINVDAAYGYETYSRDMAIQLQATVGWRF